MDKVIAPELTAKRKQKRLLYALLGLALLAGAVLSLRAALHTSLDQKSFTRATVERGDIENTLTASGEMKPEFEQVVASTIAASIQNVLVDAGATVAAGQAMLQLDKAATQAEYEKLKFGLLSKQNNIQKLRLELEKSVYDIRANNDIKQLRINSLQAAVEDAKRLFKAGGGTRENIDKAEQDLRIAQLEKRGLENEVRNKQKLVQVEMREAELLVAAQQQELKELERRLQGANVVATRPGVVTWVNKNIGATVSEGETLVRIADLSGFKVAGTISDTYLGQLRIGMPAIVVINEKTFRGTVGSINPSVQNGILAFEVQLDAKTDPLYRPNMKVDVYLVTDKRSGVLKVANGPAFKGSSAQDVFVLQGNKAVRRSVTLGVSNFDFVEVRSGLQKGDVVITSDMSGYKNVTEITINN